MFFYVDESGHTGTNLFDENQPMLYYGVLSANTNLDLIAASEVQKARKALGVDRLHASELGMGGLVEIVGNLIKLQKRYRPIVDIYRVAKPDHAIISFFDQVFDQGMNPAMTWTGYWTPLRYFLLLKVASLFDEDIAKRAWQARIDINDATAEAELVYVCQALESRVLQIPDLRSREIIGDALRWAILHPNEIYYNCKSKKDVLTITPNVIGFQTVMHGIARRLRAPKAFASITVDQQSQFNKAQKNLAEFYATTREIPWESGLGMPKMDLRNIPEAPITFSSSKESVGLELVDLYLWIFKRMMEGQDIPPELYPLVKAQLYRAVSDEVSLGAISNRWSRWFDQLSEPTENQIVVAKKIIQKDEARRKDAMGRA
tara:strand:- start:669 stop:1790 length:1122 start_codon:yes stop_codon:yes gene_type:complete